MKLKKNYAVLIFLFLLITSILFFGLRNTSLIGIGNSYTLDTKNFDILINTAEKYTERTGCISKPDLSTIGACSVQVNEIGEKLDCKLWEVMQTMYFDCDDDGYETNCAYGEVCDSSSIWGQRCTQHCIWDTRKIDAVYGGVTYDTYPNCAWDVTVKNKNNEILRIYNQKEIYPEWEKEVHYRNPVQFQDDNFVFKYVKDEYGIVQRRSDGSTIKGCRAIFFEARDDRYRYDICLGNEGIYEPVCEQALTKTCILQCPNNYEWDFDPDNCVCNPKPEIQDEEDEYIGTEPEVIEIEEIEEDTGIPVDEADDYPINDDTPSDYPDDDDDSEDSSPNENPVDMLLQNALFIVIGLVLLMFIVLIMRSRR